VNPTYDRAGDKPSGKTPKVISLSSSSDDDDNMSADDPAPSTAKETTHPSTSAAADINSNDAHAHDDDDDTNHDDTGEGGSAPLDACGSAYADGNDESSPVDRDDDTDSVPPTRAPKHKPAAKDTPHVSAHGSAVGVKGTLTAADDTTRNRGGVNSGGGGSGGSGGGGGGGGTATAAEWFERTGMLMPARKSASMETVVPLVVDDEDEDEGEEEGDDDDDDDYDGGIRRHVQSRKTGRTNALKRLGAGRKTTKSTSTSTAAAVAKRRPKRPREDQPAAAAAATAANNDGAWVPSAGLLVWAKWKHLPDWPCVLLECTQKKGRSSRRGVTWEVHFLGDGTAETVIETSIRAYDKRQSYHERLVSNGRLMMRCGIDQSRACPPFWVQPRAGLCVFGWRGGVSPSKIALSALA